MTRVKRNTRSISSFLGTLPNSSWRATAILALRSFFFCSVVILVVYQNSLHLPSFETLVLKLVLILSGSLLLLKNLSSIWDPNTMASPVYWADEQTQQDHRTRTRPNC